MTKKRTLKISKDSQEGLKIVTPFTYYDFDIISVIDGVPCNPVPYTRTTQKTYGKNQVNRYNKFKDVIRGAFYKKYGKLPHIDAELKRQFVKGEVNPKPLNIPDVKHYMDVFIWFGKGQRGDKDNIAKGIADALFVDDERVSFNADYYTRDGEVVIFPAPKVHVTITSWDTWLRWYKDVSKEPGKQLIIPHIIRQRLELY